MNDYSQHDSIAYTLSKLLEERVGIRLKPGYLETWLSTVARGDRETLYIAALDHCLNTNIAETSVPVIPSDFGKETLSTFPTGHLRNGPGIVLQIQDTIDISHSTHSLLNNIASVAPVRQVYVRRNQNEDITFPRGMLRWTLTDGTRTVRAIEYKRFPNLDLKTPFGCKLLIKSCQVRQGILFLDPVNVKVLGGSVLQLYDGNMIAALERRFRIRLRLEQPDVPDESGESDTRQDPIDTDTVTDMTPVVAARTTTVTAQQPPTPIPVQSPASKRTNTMTCSISTAPSIIPNTATATAASGTPRTTASKQTGRPTQIDFRGFAAQFAFDPSTTTTTSSSTKLPSLTAQRPKSDSSRSQQHNRQLSSTEPRSSAGKRDSPSTHIERNDLAKQEQNEAPGIPSSANARTKPGINATVVSEGKEELILDFTTGQRKQPDPGIMEVDDVRSEPFTNAQGTMHPLNKNNSSAGNRDVSTDSTPRLDLAIDSLPDRNKSRLVPPVQGQSCKRKEDYKEHQSGRLDKVQKTKTTRQNGDKDYTTVNDAISIIEANSVEQLVVKAVGVKLLQFRLSPSLGYHLAASLKDPYGDQERKLHVVFKHEVIKEMIGRDHREVNDKRNKLGSTWLARDVLEPLRQKLTTQCAYYHLDLTLMEKDEKTGNFMPIVTKYIPH